KNLSRHHSILLLSLLEFPEEAEQVSHLKPYCELVEVVVSQRHSLWAQGTGIARGLLAGRPVATQPFFYEELACKVREVTAREDVDIIQIEHSFLAPYVEALPPHSACKKVLSFHNIGSQQYRRMLHLQTGVGGKLLSLLKWLLMLRWEARYAKKFDHCLVVSAVDGQLLQSANPAVPVSVIENGVDTALYQPLIEAPNSKVLLFVGTMGYPPNVDAVRYFYDAVMPLVRRQVRDVKLMIVGHHPRSEVRHLAKHDDVIVTGSVPDVIPYYQQSQVSIIPLRAGGGTRLKILESMALGRPVVSTALGCEGLEVVDQEHLMIADTPAEFAERVIQLLTDRELRDRISRNARHLVERRYDWSLSSQKLMAVYSSLTA
ncbi:MAG: glycosyltransferase family 4 protein, partial [Candidatus Binatia bacterium]